MGRTNEIEKLKNTEYYKRKYVYVRKEIRVNLIWGRHSLQRMTSTNSCCPSRKIVVNDFSHHQQLLLNLLTEANSLYPTKNWADYPTCPLHSCMHALCTDHPAWHVLIHHIWMANLIYWPWVQCNTILELQCMLILIRQGKDLKRPTNHKTLTLNAVIWWVWARCLSMQNDQPKSGNGAILVFEQQWLYACYSTCTDVVM